MFENLICLKYTLYKSKTKKKSGKTKEVKVPTKKKSQADPTGTESENVESDDFADLMGESDTNEKVNTIQNQYFHRRI